TPSQASPDQTSHPAPHAERPWKLNRQAPGGREEVPREGWQRAEGSREETDTIRCPQPPPRRLDTLPLDNFPPLHFRPTHPLSLPLSPASLPLSPLPFPRTPSCPPPSPCPPAASVSPTSPSSPSSKVTAPGPTSGAPPSASSTPPSRRPTAAS